MIKEDGEENLGNHDSHLAQSESHPSSSSPEAHWEEGQEVIPTFFSTMNTRYSVLSNITDSWIRAFLLESQCWCSFQGVAYPNRIENVAYQASALLFTLPEAVDEKELDCESILCQQVLACFGGLSLENDFIRLCYNRSTVTGAYLWDEVKWFDLQRGSCFHDCLWTAEHANVVFSIFPPLYHQIV